VSVEVGRFDRTTQRVDKCHVGLGAGGPTLEPLALRYVWPSELDLMARLAGLRRRERWGGWSGRAVHRSEPAARLGVRPLTRLRGTRPEVPRDRRVGHDPVGAVAGHRGDLDDPAEGRVRDEDAGDVVRSSSRIATWF
jgi:hypothetical protein